MTKMAVTKITNNDYEVKITGKGTAYSSTYLDATTELSIDARGDRVYISMTEYKPETNRGHGSSITITRDEWNQIKELIKKTGGEL
jgi:hypothetical protein